MKPVMQTSTDRDTGDCLRACMASLMDLPLEAVPDLSPAATGPRGKAPSAEDQDELLFEWLDSRRLRGISVYFKNNVPIENVRIDDENGEHFLVWGPSKHYGDRNHTVVAHCRHGQIEVAHDPHPDKPGLDQVNGFMFVVPSDR